MCYDYVDDRIFGGEDQRFWSHTTTHTTLSKSFDTKLAPSAASELRWGQIIKTAPVGYVGSWATTPRRRKLERSWQSSGRFCLLPQTKLSSLASSRSVNKLSSPLGLRRFSFSFSRGVAAQLTSMGQSKHKAERKGSTRTREGKTPETKPSMRTEQPLAT